MAARILILALVAGPLVGCTEGSPPIHRAQPSASPSIPWKHPAVVSRLSLRQPPGRVADWGPSTIRSIREKGCALEGEELADHTSMVSLSSHEIAVDVTCPDGRRRTVIVYLHPRGGS